MGADQASSMFAVDDRSISSDVSNSNEDGSSGSSSSSGSGIKTLVPLAWWINPSSLRLEDLVFSIVIDILAAAGALGLADLLLLWHP
jgi:hypothetical protein